MMTAPIQRLIQMGDLRPEQWPSEEWSNRGLKPVGYLCSYVPEEILVAAGLHPVRVTGVPQEGTPKADSLILSNSCGFLRSALDFALDGGYSFFKGIVTTDSCENMRRVYDIWKRNVCHDYFHFILSLPRHVGSPTAVARYASDLHLLKDAVERHFDTHITTESLWEAIRLYNTTRRLWERLYELMAIKGRRISSADVLRVEKAAMWVPRVEFNQLMEEALEELETAPPGGEPDGLKRVLFSGSILVSPEYFEIIEEMGATVVADDLCTGSRYFGDLVEESGDPIQSLSARYLNRVPCPRMFGNEQRLSHIVDLMKRFDADAVILSPLKYCDPHLYSAPIIQDRLEKLGISVLRLDREYAPSSIGQLKTRVQAFLEMLDNEN